MKRRAPFRTTHWTLVRQAGADPENERLGALDALVRQYSPALVEFVTQSYRVSELQAEEWVQGFVVNRVLSRRLLKSADQSRGKFRTFLLQAIQSYISDERRAASAQKRTPPNGFLSIDELTESTAPSSSSAEDGSIFDEIFARQLILDAIRRTHEYCSINDLGDGWQVFSGRIIGPLFEDLTPTPYETIIEEAGLPSQGVAYSKLATVKDIFRRQFRGLIDEYAADRGERDVEIRYFKQFLKK